MMGNNSGSQPAETSLGRADGKKTSNQPGKGKQTIAAVDTVDHETEINIGKNCK